MSVLQSKTRLAALILTLILTPSCAKLTASETTKAVLTQVSATLPTAARSDAAQTKREVAVHRKVVFDLCGDLKAECVE